MGEDGDLSPLKDIWIHPTRAFKTAVDSPDLFRISIFVAVGGFAFGVTTMYATTMIWNFHMIAAWSLASFLLWLLWSLISGGFWRILGKKFSFESWVESGLISWFPFLTSFLVFFVPFGIYHRIVRDYLPYPGLLYYGLWKVAAIPIGIGLFWTMILCTLMGMRVLETKWYKSFIVGAIAALFALIIPYLIWRGWL